MSDYPTRAEIDAANTTIYALAENIDRESMPGDLMYRALRAACLVLEDFDTVPGLQPSAHEPKPTAAEVLHAAYVRAEHKSAEEAILWAAEMYATDHPEWFRHWYDNNTPAAALNSAATAAIGDGNEVAGYALMAAVAVANARRDLFGGAA